LSRLFVSNLGIDVSSLEKAITPSAVTFRKQKSKATFKTHTGIRFVALFLNIYRYNYCLKLKLLLGKGHSFLSRKVTEER
jgi:hypothetical protein